MIILIKQMTQSFFEKALKFVFGRNKNRLFGLFYLSNNKLVDFDFLERLFHGLNFFVLLLLLFLDN